MSNGCTQSFAYDALSRLTSQTLPDGSKIEYEYDSIYLRKVHRRSKEGELLYTHTNEAFDENGNLLKARLPGNAKEISFSIDPHHLETIQDPPFAAKTKRPEQLTSAVRF